MPELFDEDPAYDSRSTQELLALASDGRQPVPARGRAVTALGRRAKQDANLVPVLKRLASDTELQKKRMFRLVSLAYLAVAGLAHVASEESLAAAAEVASGLTSEDRDSLMRFLRSGNFPTTPGGYDSNLTGHPDRA